VIVTDTLNGRTVEDIQRNADGSVSFYCDSGHDLTLYVKEGQIEAMPPRMILPDAPVVELHGSKRMRLLEAFQGFMVNYAYYDDQGCIIFVCEPLHDGFFISHGHREIRVTHTNGRIDELPPVSAVVKLPSLAVFGEKG
jgi:hypothetical protein